jgi:hypothetical protein
MSRLLVSSSDQLHWAFSRLAQLCERELQPGEAAKFAIAPMRATAAFRGSVDGEELGTVPT